MKKPVAFLLLGLGIFTVARADDTPHLEFVKQLRAKQYGDLALRYLDVLEKEGSPEVVAFIPIERASIYLDQAQQSTNIAERSRLYEKARAGFETFIKNSKAKSPALAAIAQLESSRILAMQGRSRLARTRNLGDAAREAEMRSILRTFEDANLQLERAGKEIDDQLLGKNPPKKMAEELGQRRLQADLEIAQNQFDQAMTYDGIPDKGAVERGKKIDTAQRAFHDLYGRDRNGTLGRLARAWEIKCFFETDQVKDAKKIYDEVKGDTHPKGDLGRRFAQFFCLQMLSTERSGPAVKEAFKLKADEDVHKEIQSVAREWLRQYPSHINSSEGTTVRFELARSLRLQGEAFPKIGKDKDQLDARAVPFLNQALDIYKELAEVDSEYAAEVEHYVFRLRMDLADGNTVFNPGDARKLTSFTMAIGLSEKEGIRIGKEELEMIKLENKKGKTAADDAKLAELKKTFPERRKQHMANVQEILLRALELLQEGKTKAKKKDILEAHANLAWILMSNGDLHRAVVVGEHAAHIPVSDPTEIKHAAQAAAWAVQAYVQLIAKGTREGYAKEIVESDRERFRRLVDYMDGTWRDDTSTDSARHQLGSQLLAEKKFKDAEDWLSRVSDRYDAGGLIDARYRWCVACQELAKEAKTDADKKKYQQQSIKALRGVPELTGKVAPSVAGAYVRCKIMLGGILFDSKEYNELERVALALKSQVSALKIDDAEKADLLRTANSLLNYAKYGRATEEVNQGRYGAAMKLIDEPMASMEKEIKALRAKEDAIRKPYLNDIERAETFSQNNQDLPKDLKDRMEEFREKVEPLQQAIAPLAELYRGLLLVGLRACVQDGNKGRARGLLEELLAEARRDKIGLRVLVQLVAQLKKQIDELKAKGDAKSQAQLDTLVSNFISFLDALAKQPKLDASMIFFLANSYSSIGVYKDRNLHLDAVKLLEQVKEPKAEPGVPFDKKAEVVHHQARLMMVQELRMGRKFKEAGTVLNDILSKPWGKGFSVKKEKPLLLMDQGFYGGAAKAWNQIIGELTGRLNGGDAKVKENYYESYYQFNYCLVMYAKTVTDPKIKAKAGDYFKRAANNILKLEETPPGDMGGEGFKKRYQDLLANEPLLKKEYDTIKKEKGAAPKTTAGK